ncbi:aryl-alcohol dehydrogenase [Amylostereum chailletii]|nr:aryl-alcohol dehydrogenase [Amylostereum chailletii]
MAEVVSRNIPYVRLGNSGLKISKIVLGCMSYGNPNWQPWVLGEEEAIQHIKYAYEHGVNTFDTANVYSNGVSESVLGKAIKQLKINRDEIVVITKVGFCLDRNPNSTIFARPASELDTMGYPNQYGLSRKHIFASVKASLERLQLDYVDVLLCHRFDYNTPIEETMQALHDVVQAGHVRYIGMSSCFAWQFHAMQNYAIANKLTPFIAMQNHYSLAYREEEREMMPTLKHFGVGSMAWSPLARGVLTRPVGTATTRSGSDALQRNYQNGAGTDAIVARVEEVAKKRGVPMAQVALAWTLSRATSAVVGTTSLEKLAELLGAVDVELTEEEKKAMEEPYVPRTIFGHA